MNRILAAANAAALAAIVALAWHLHGSIGRGAGLEARLMEVRARRLELEPARGEIVSKPAPEPGGNPKPGPAVSQSAARVAECLEGIIKNPAYAYGFCNTLAGLDPDAVIAGLRERW